MDEEHRVRDSISVVIPTFRRPTMLRECLLGCLQQSDAEELLVDIIVVDNCPKGSALSVVKELEPRGKGLLRYVSEPRPGISHARNAGLEHAKGRYVAFIDDDEVASRVWLQRLHRTARVSAADVVLGPVVPTELLPGDSGEPDIPTGSVLGSTSLTPFWARRDRTYRRLATNNALLDHQSDIVMNARFDPRLGLTGGEDVEYFNRLLRNGARIVWCADALVTETVPSERLDIRYALERSFRGGQMISWAPMLTRPKMPWMTALTMAIGASQIPAYLTLALLNSGWSRGKRDKYLTRTAAAFGKIFWSAPFRAHAYGNDALPETKLREERSRDQA